jgi:hypothetical protein
VPSKLAETVAAVPINVKSNLSPVKDGAVAVALVTPIAALPVVKVGSAPALKVSAALEPPLNAVILLAEPVLAAVKIKVSASSPLPIEATEPLVAKLLLE